MTTADQPRVIDALPHLAHPDVRRLLAASMDDPDAAELDQLAAYYRHAPEPTVVFGVRDRTGLLGVTGAVARSPGRCEVLNLAVDPRARRQGLGRRLLSVAAAALHADAVLAHTDAEAVAFYRACGFTLEPVGEVRPGLMRYLAHRPAAGLSDDTWSSAPVGHRDGPYGMTIALPPGGNTLPRVPDALADQRLPAFVVEWILETDEIGLMLQELLPDRFPPTTPAIRPARVRDFLGPVTRTAALVGTAAPADASPAQDPDTPIPGLPAGVTLPMAVLEVAEMGQRIGAWIDKGQRVARWAETHGHGDAPWIVPDL
ncbi:MAG: GNAT family N-acetyltransferase [Nitriliruptoraceae bacterium]